MCSTPGSTEPITVGGLAGIALTAECGPGELTLGVLELDGSQVAFTLAEIGIEPTDLLWEALGTLELADAEPPPIRTTTNDGLWLFDEPSLDTEILVLRNGDFGSRFRYRYDVVTPTTAVEIQTVVIAIQDRIHTDSINMDVFTIDKVQTPGG